VPVTIYAVPAYNVFKISVLVNVAKYVFTHAVVGTLEELSAVDKEEDMIGFVKKVVGPLTIVEAFNDPMVSDPPDKLDPTVIAAV
jgi:hypothetical protein